MKKCPYCAEEIQDEAVKCKHCSSMLEQKPKLEWYFKTSTLVIALLSVGPFALPLLWFNPRFKTSVKIIWSVILLVLSYYLWVMVLNTWKSYTSMINLQL